MKSGTIVIVNLQSPREKMVGRLISVTLPGITARGIDVESFRGWLNQFQHPEGESTFQPSTVFFPMHRVVSCYQDESSGAAPSFSSQFHDRTGRELAEELK